MKYLVTGSAGLIGSQIVKNLSISDNKIFSCYHIDKPLFGTPIQLDLLDPKQISQKITDIHPDVIIHIAALRDVDKCEVESSLASRLNIDATDELSKQANKINAFFVYVSTDYVFDGKQGMRKEEDITNPLTIYGLTKLEGEKRVVQNIKHWSIARTSTPYGLHPKQKSFPVWVLENLIAKKQINIVDDQFTSPVYVPNLSQMLIEISQKKICGTIHLGGATRISRFAFAEIIAEKLNLDKKLIVPTHMSNMTWKVPRPIDSSLDVSLATSLLETKPMNVNEGIDCFIDDIKSSNFLYK